MSLHRLAAYRGLRVSARNTARNTVKFNTSHLTRWQSETAPSGSGRGGRGVVKKIIIGLVVGGASIGGTLAYGNYNPAFRNQVDERLPGFASWTDKAADIWVDITDYFHPNPQEGQGTNEAVVKARLDELKKNKPISSPPKNPEDAKSGSLADEKEGEKGEKAPGKSTKIKKDAKAEVKKDSPETKSDTSQSKEVETRQNQEEQVSRKKMSDEEEPEKEVPPKPSGTTSSVPLQDSPPASTSLPVPPTQSSQSQPPDQSSQEQPEAEKREVKTVKDEKVGLEQPGDFAVGSLSHLDSAQIGVLLEETYEIFMSNTDKVKEAQQTLISSWENLYLMLASPDQHQDSAISEAKAATSEAHGKFKVAADEYDRSCRRLKELVASAPEKGFVAKAAAIASDVRVKEAEVDLGLVLMKEAITSATVVEGYREAIQEGREKLKDDLEAAASLIDPERRDSILLLLNKKVELLDQKLKESEAEHSQKLMLALEVQRRGLEQLAGEKLKHSLKESEAKHQQLLVKEINEVSSTYNGMMREQLRLENESHAEKMRQALSGQANQLNSKWSSEMELKLLNQQGFYQTELAKAKARLGGLESMVDGLAHAGEKTLRLQTLHNSCDTLSSALDNAKFGDATDRYTIGTEVDSLRRAAASNLFVATVLDSIPSQAVSGEGLQPEASLRERFVKVKRVCRRVALVPETGGGLGTYAVSFIQSMLTVRPWLSKIPTDVDPSGLDAYNLLHLADDRLRKGDLEGAVYYMNCLQGEPRNVAKDWLKDAKLYLETRQAIQLIQTYMSANVAGNQ